MKTRFPNKVFTAILTLSYLFFCSLLWRGPGGEVLSQTPEFTVIQTGIPSGDSSYYHVCKISEDEFWAIGKKGIITKFGTSGIAETFSYPNKGVDLLNMVLMDDNNYLLCGDKGFIYQFSKSAQSWNVLQVKGYENSCFYSVCAIDNNTAFISGGRSKIVKSQRVVPLGFILKTEDGGKTWKQVFRSVSGMIWSVKYEKETNQILALVYSPVKTRLIYSADKGMTWKPKEKKIKGLFHDFNISEGKLFLAGGKNGNYRKNGAVRFEKNIFLFENSGIFWDVEANKTLTIASGTDGNLLIKKFSEDWKLLKSPVTNNLYEVCFIDEKSAFLVGNNKTILKVEFK